MYNKKYKVYVNCYEDFGNIITDKNFDFISIDGSYGGEKISRIDILPYIPQCLEKSFCIILDDYEREGEKNMIIELENILQKNQIEYYKVIYGDDKKFCLITSKDNLFLRTLY